MLPIRSAYQSIRTRFTPDAAKTPQPDNRGLAPHVQKPVEPFVHAQVTDVVQRNNALGFAMLDADGTSQGPQEALVSPMSITLALGMLAGGADATTRRTFCDKLGVPETKSFAESLAPMTHVMACANPETLSGGNAVFAESSYRFKQTFLAHTAALGAETSNHFDKLPDAEDAINAWVSQKTHAMISNFTNRHALGHHHFALVNALGFKGRWMRQFDPQKTRTDYPFRAPQGARNVDMMMRTNERLLVSKNENYTAVCLPYEGATSTSGLFFIGYLPNQGRTLADTRLALQQSPANDLFSEQQVAQFGLPKFTFAAGDGIKAVLSRLGFPMDDVFTEIGEDKTAVGEVLHKTQITVSEEGTHAAAATAILSFGSAAHVSSLNIMFDRPFIFSVVDASRMAVFTGIYA